MGQDDAPVGRGARAERGTRIAGGLLLGTALLVSLGTDLLFGRAQHMVLFEGYDLAARVLAPGGAMLVATSLSIRALIRPFSAPTARAQLMVALALLGAGLLQMLVGPQVLTSITELLGPTGNAGALLVTVLARVVYQTALPLGIALLAVQPLVRVAPTLLARSSSPGTPDLETLD
jgi:hypothetical protein